MYKKLIFGILFFCLIPLLYSSDLSDASLPNILLCKDIDCNFIIKDNLSVPGEFWVFSNSIIISKIDLIKNDTLFKSINDVKFYLEEEGDYEVVITYKFNSLVSTKILYLSIRSEDWVDYSDKPLFMEKEDYDLLVKEGSTFSQIFPDLGLKDSKSKFSLSKYWYLFGILLILVLFFIFTKSKNEKYINRRLRKKAFILFFLIILLTPVYSMELESIEDGNFTYPQVINVNITHEYISNFTFVPLISNLDLDLNSTPRIILDENNSEYIETFKSFLDNNLNSNLNTLPSDNQTITGINTNKSDLFAKAEIIDVYLLNYDILRDYVPTYFVANSNNPLQYNMQQILDFYYSNPIENKLDLIYRTEDYLRSNFNNKAIDLLIKDKVLIPKNILLKVSVNSNYFIGECTIFGKIKFDDSFLVNNQDIRLNINYIASGLITYVPTTENTNAVKLVAQEKGWDLLSIDYNSFYNYEKIIDTFEVYALYSDLRYFFKGEDYLKFIFDPSSDVYSLYPLTTDANNILFKYINTDYFLITKKKIEHKLFITTIKFSNNPTLQKTIVNNYSPIQIDFNSTKFRFELKKDREDRHKLNINNQVNYITKEKPYYFDYDLNYIYFFKFEYTGNYVTKVFVYTSPYDFTNQYKLSLGDGNVNLVGYLDNTNSMNPEVIFRDYVSERSFILDINNQQKIIPIKDNYILKSGNYIITFTKREDLQVFLKKDIPNEVTYKQVNFYDRNIQKHFKSDYSIYLSNQVLFLINKDNHTIFSPTISPVILDHMNKSISIDKDMPNKMNSNLTYINATTNLSELFTYQDINPDGEYQNKTYVNSRYRIVPRINAYALEVYRGDDYYGQTSVVDFNLMTDTNSATNFEDKTYYCNSKIISNQLIHIKFKYNNHIYVIDYNKPSGNYLLENYEYKLDENISYLFSSAYGTLMGYNISEGLSFTCYNWPFNCRSNNDKNISIELIDYNLPTYQINCNVLINTSEYDTNNELIDFSFDMPTDEFLNNYPSSIVSFDEINKQINDFSKSKDYKYLLIIGDMYSFPMFSGFTNNADTFIEKTLIVDSFYGNQQSGLYDPFDVSNYSRLNIGRLPLFRENDILNYYSDFEYNYKSTKAMFIYEPKGDSNLTKFDYAIYPSVILLDLFRKGINPIVYDVSNNSAVYLYLALMTKFNLIYNPDILLFINSKEYTLEKLLLDNNFSNIYVYSHGGENYFDSFNSLPIDSTTTYEGENISDLRFSKKTGIITDACNTAYIYGPMAIEHGVKYYFGNLFINYPFVFSRYAYPYTLNHERTIGEFAKNHILYHTSINNSASKFGLNIDGFVLYGDPSIVLDSYN